MFCGSMWHIPGAVAWVISEVGVMTIVMAVIRHHWCNVVKAAIMLRLTPGSHLQKSWAGWPLCMLSDCVTMPKVGVNVITTCWYWLTLTLF